MLRYIYFIEGACFVLSSLVVLPRWGISGMLLCAIGCAALFSFPYGLWRTAKYFRERPATVLVSWLQPSLQVAIIFIPLAAGVWYLTRSLPAFGQLTVRVALLAPLGGWLLLSRGLDKEARHELQQRMPARWRRQQDVRTEL